MATDNQPFDADRQRKRRNLYIAGAIVVFVVLIFVVTVLRLSAAASGAA